MIPVFCFLAILHDPIIARINAISPDAPSEEAANGNNNSGSESDAVSETPSMEIRRMQSFSRFQKFVPIILTLADFSSSIGAGMTVKFFALFFVNDIKFNASQ